MSTKQLVLHQREVTPFQVLGAAVKMIAKKVQQLEKQQNSMMATRSHNQPINYPQVNTSFDYDYKKYTKSVD